MARPFYDTYTMGRILWKIHAIPLKTSQAFYDATLREVMDHANGPGPARWPDEFRRLADRALEFLDPIFVIHDYDYDSEVNDGSRTLWHLVNERMLENGKLLARHEFPLPEHRWGWLHMIDPRSVLVVWKRWRALAVVRALFMLVESPEGYDAWFDACHKRMAKLGGAL